MRTERAITSRMQAVWEAELAAERSSGLYDPAYMEWAHSKGFLAESACAYGLTDADVHRYISDYEYASLWPLNSWQRIWINDKLTLRYVLHGTEWEDVLPRYYFYTEQGSIRAIPGTGYEDSAAGLASCLEDVRELACKPCNGQLSQGFHKLGYDACSGAYSIDRDVLRDARELGDFVAAHQNNVITEYIHPAGYLSEIHPLIHTLRVLVGRVNGGFEVLGAYLRFGLSLDSQSNYTVPDRADISNYTVGVDISSGAFGQGKVIFANKIEEAPRHPSTGVLAEGTLREWGDVEAAAIGIAETLGFVEYLGYDFGITDQGVRLMEINSHPGLKYIQLFTPGHELDAMSRYFTAKLQQLDALDDATCARRKAIVR